MKVYSYKLAKKILSLKPFEKFRKDLEKMSMVIDSMQLWIENRIVDGTIPEELLARAEEQQK